MNTGPTSTQTDPTPTEPPATPTAEPGLCDVAEFVWDVTVADGSFFSPGEPFTKVWRLKNAGTCTWTPGYDLAFLRGDGMNAPGLVPLKANVRLLVHALIGNAWWSLAFGRPIERNVGSCPHSHSLKRDERAKLLV